MPDYTCLKDLLEVMLVPIFLTGLALWLPRRWQNKQKELELKTGLVSEISDAVMTMIAESQVIWDDKLISTLGTDKELVLEKKLLKAHMDWTVKSCIIGSKIHAYYPIHKESKEDFRYRLTPQTIRRLNEIKGCEKLLEGLSDELYKNNEMRGNFRKMRPGGEFDKEVIEKLERQGYKMNESEKIAVKNNSKMGLNEKWNNLSMEVDEYFVDIIKYIKTQNANGIQKSLQSKKSEILYSKYLLINKVLKNKISDV